MPQISLLFILIFGCHKYTPQEVSTALMDQNYLMITEEDTVQMEFMEYCVANYNWDWGLINDWDVGEIDGSIYLHLNFSNFKLVDKDKNGFEFYDSKNNRKIIKAIKSDLKLEYLQGVWSDSIYLNMVSNTTFPPPPCPNFYPQDSSLIPGYIFKLDSCFIQNDCYRRRSIYIINSDFGIISFEKPCVSTHQLKIKHLTPNSMVVDRRFYDNQIGSEIKYELGKKYIKTAN